MVDFERRPLNIKARPPWIPGLISPGMIAGLLLVLLGTLLFIDNLDLLPFSVTGAFWPLAILAYSTATLYRTCSHAVRVFAIAGLVWGTLLLLNNLHIIHVRGTVMWPLLLIASGVVLLIYRLGWPDIPWGEWAASSFRIGSNARTRTMHGKVGEYAVFSAVKRKIDTVGFEGGELTAVFGSIEVDLRRAAISTADRRAFLETNAVFGSVELRIPESWQVSLEGHALFGAYEDKTIPPRPDPGSPVSTLIIQGGTAFGAVTVKN